VFKVKVSSIGLLSILLISVLNDPANAQVTGSWWDGWNANWRIINKQQMRNMYGDGNNLCHSIIASEWRYYQRQQASGKYYPDAEAVRLQRKWETKKGCTHLYNADGSVNRIPGIND
jgi:hypothetical protein